MRSEVDGGGASGEGRREAGRSAVSRARRVGRAGGGVGPLVVGVGVLVLVGEGEAEEGGS